MMFDESDQTKHGPASARAVLLQRLVLRSRLARYAMAALLAALSVAARLALEPLWALNLPLITLIRPSSPARCSAASDPG